MGGWVREKELLCEARDWVGGWVGVWENSTGVAADWAERRWMRPRV